MFCFFESSDRHFTRNRRKSVQKVFELVSAFQVVEERFNGHAGPAKNGSSAKNVRVFCDNSHEGIVSRGIVASAGDQYHLAERKEEERFLSAQADAFAGANAEEKVGLLRSK